MKSLIGLGTAFLLAMSGAVMAQGHGNDGHQGQDHGGGGRQCQGQTEPGKSRVGEEVKDFTFTDNSGKSIRLGSLRRTEESKGSIAVLTFWCTTCMSCRQMEKDFAKKAKEYKEKGVLFFMVASNSTESVESVNRFLERNELSFPVLMDANSELAWYFGATLTTTTAVIDMKGRLRYYGGFGKAEDAIRDLLADKDVAVPESRGSG